MSAFLELGRESSSLVVVSACLNAGHRPLRARWQAGRRSERRSLPYHQARFTPPILKPRTKPAHRLCHEADTGVRIRPANRRGWAQDRLQK